MNASNYPNLEINSHALSAATMIPNCGLTVKGATIEPSTTCRFFMPITVVFVSTHVPKRQELDQWFTSPSAYAEYVVIYVWISAIDEL